MRFRDAEQRLARENRAQVTCSTNIPALPVCRGGARQEARHHMASHAKRTSSRQLRVNVNSPSRMHCAPGYSGRPVFALWTVTGHGLEHRCALAYAAATRHTGTSAIGFPVL